MTYNNLPIVETQMLIRKPAEMVFEAFIDPAITTNFWFTKASDRLEAGKTVTWEWEMFNFSDPANFGKFFKKHTGMTPVEYRKSSTSLL